MELSEEVKKEKSNSPLKSTQKQTMQISIACDSEEQAHVLIHLYVKMVIHLFLVIALEIMQKNHFEYDVTPYVYLLFFAVYRLLSVF